MNKWLVLAVMSLLTVMLNIDATAVNIAIPVISHDFHAKLSNMQWVISAFVLLSSVLQILGGRLGDLFGHRRLFNVGTILFMVGSLVAALSLSSGLLITGRVIQGISLGLAYPMTIVIAYSVFPKEEHGTVMGVIMGVMGFSLALGPTIGGAIIEVASWRWIFYINLPIGLLTIILSYLYCPKDQPSGTVADLDLPGAFFLIVGLVGVILAINQSQNWGLLSPLFLSVLAAGITCLLILYFVEKNKPNPLMAFNIFCSKAFSLHSAIRVISQCVFIPVLFFIPLYLVNVIEFSPLKSGLIVLVLTIVIAISSPLCGKWVDRSGDKLPTVISMLLFAVGSALLAVMPLQPNYVLLCSGLVLVGLGCGVSFVSTTTGALRDTKPEQAGVATGIFFTIAWGSCALGIAVSGAILALVSEHYLMAKLSAHSLLSQPQLAELIRVARGLSPSSVLHDDFSANLIAVTHQAFISGFHAVMWTLAASSLLGFFLALQLDK